MSYLEIKMDSTNLIILENRIEKTELNNCVFAKVYIVSIQ